MTEPSAVAAQSAVVLDPEVRRSADGRTLIGGSPLRVMRLSVRGGQVLDALLDGALDGWTPGTRALVTRLLDAGLVHPQPGSPDAELADVTVVVPHRDNPDGLNTLLSLLPVDQLAKVVVVDDASKQPPRLDNPHVGLVRRFNSGGPGVARQQGAAEATSEFLLFLDSDVTTNEADETDWERLLAHFNDPLVAAVAPRVASSAGTTLLERYEAARSPLDLGPTLANVRPRSRVSYVPTAALLVRRDAFEEVGGFDPDLRVGEDVDLIWRFVKAGRVVRYEPKVVVGHAPRHSWAALAAQRTGYGQSAALLAQRHPHAITPFEASPWSAAAWALLLAGGRFGTAAGVATAVGSTVALAPKLRNRVDDPTAEAIRLAGKGHLYVGLLAAEATRRAWLPLAVAGAVVSQRLRVATVAAFVVPPLIEWAQQRPRVDPVRWVGLRGFDDASYCRGVWEGMRAAGSLAAIRPRFPGLSQLLPGGAS